MVNIPMEAYIQKDLRAGSCVVAPIPKAIKSVMEVMVMATPACSMVLPNLSTTPLPWCCSDKVFRHWMMTNMSSMPIPSIRKGMTVWAGEYQKPMVEQTP